jgi:translocation and assembly module TamA
MTLRAPFLAPARSLACACFLAGAAAFAASAQAPAAAASAESAASAATSSSAASAPALEASAPASGASAPTPAASSAAPAAAASAAGTATRRPELVVEAPTKSLKTLLEANLDIEHATTLAEAESLDDSEWARLIAATPAQATALAETQGYFRAEATVTPDPENPQRLVIRLAPGAPATVDKLTFEFDGDIAGRADEGDPGAVAFEQQLREGWLMQPGSVFRNADWEKAKGQVLTQLRAHGYAAALWTATSAQVDPERNRVRLFIVADSGPRFRAGDIVVEGLERQPEKNVLDLAGFGPGAPLTQRRLQDYSDRLLKTGLFDQVAVTYDADPQQADHATVNVHVHEQSLQQATIAVGYSSGSNTSSGTSLTSGWRVTLQHTNREILGYPATLTNKIQWGHDIKEWDGELVTHPAENFHSWLVGASLGHIVSTDDIVNSAYVRFGRTQTSNPLDRTTFVQVERSNECAADFCAGTTIDASAVSLNQQGVWRRVDSVVLPTSGYTVSAQVGAGLAGVQLANVGPFLRLYGRVTGYWPLAHEWFSQARLELGQIFVKGDVQMPDAEQWRAGGEGSVRGYEWRSLAPGRPYTHSVCHTDPATQQPVCEDVTETQVVGGNALITSSVEVAHVITQNIPSLWWAMFVDAGAASERFDNIDIRRGYGLGIRWRSPVGPLSVDWSWGDPERQWGRIDLSVGIVF